ncbi:protein phosphatase PTC7 homolog isoform X1 [Tubulanus polymorphus]|uniref:protein phosphatase PTC7 homolog isoform X1 n=1 Tax=Tubulanus polymorphus TaxID=672921 RepID=UPI003DA36F29
MQSIVVYGRLLARAIASGIHNEIPSWRNRQTAAGYHLVTASSGHGYHHNNTSPAQLMKKWSFGDDACFFAKHNLADVMGIADGVGGWRSYGIDPSQFSYALMQTCERMVCQGKFRPKEPAGLIASSYAEILEQKNPLLGSCTACLVSLHKEDQILYTANLGDSGFLVVRNGKVVHRSEEQQHYFNTPFQLSITPPLGVQMMISDSPESADSTAFPVEEGDIIVLGTDGLFDNLTDEMIIEHLRSHKTNSLSTIQNAANGLVNMAVTKSYDPEYISPFCIAARDAGINCLGGKPDDITVLLASVQTGELMCSS